MKSVVPRQRDSFTSYLSTARHTYAMGDSLLGYGHEHFTSMVAREWYTVKNRMGVLRDTWLQSPKELVQVFLRVDIAEVFEDTQFIVGYCARTLSAVVRCPNACWRDTHTAMNMRHRVSDTIVGSRPSLFREWRFVFRPASSGTYV